MSKTEIGGFIPQEQLKSVPIVHLKEQVFGGNELKKKAQMVEMLAQTVAPEKKGTAAHEINHAIVAIMVGSGFSSLSISREGNSLGRVNFSGHIDPHKIGVIAAAGMVDTVYGGASGYSSDLEMAKEAEYAGGHTVGSAVAEASSHINKIPHDVRIKIAELVALQGGEVNEGEFRRIWREAEELSGLGKNGKANLPNEHKKQKSEYTTVIDERVDGTYIEYKKEGKIIETHFMCRACGGYDAHSESCVNFVKKVNNINEKQDDNKENKIKPFGTVYNHEENKKNSL